MTVAKIFWSGNSQAIRLPKEYRFSQEVREVEIHREGERIILEPVQVDDWPESFWRAFDGMPEDFERPAQVRQTRSDFDL